MQDYQFLQTLVNELQAEQDLKENKRRKRQFKKIKKRLKNVKITPGKSKKGTSKLK